MGVLLLLFSIPFIYRESQRNVELYVNPAFKISDFNSFYVEYPNGSVDDMTMEISIGNILKAGGLSPVYSKEEATLKTLYMTIRIENGFIFPPHIGHFNPQIFYPKTRLVEIYNGKSQEQLLLRLYTWRGFFRDGYGPYEYDDFLEKGLSQAGWQEKVSGILIKFKAAEPAEPAD